MKDCLKMCALTCVSLPMYAACAGLVACLWEAAGGRRMSMSAQGNDSQHSNLLQVIEQLGWQNLLISVMQHS